MLTLKLHTNFKLLLFLVIKYLVSNNNITVSVFKIKSYNK